MALFFILENLGFIYFYIVQLLYISNFIKVYFRYSGKWNSPTCSLHEVLSQGSDGDHYLSSASEGIYYFWPRFFYILAIGSVSFVTHCEFICSTLSSISLSVLTIYRSWYIDSIPYSQTRFLTYVKELCHQYLF